ncbi:hypothetical protein MBLNU13_g00376t2 [Cladosporium sp. NU13]
MQFTTVLVVLTATLASGAAIERSEPTHQLAKRGCYSVGEDWAEQKENALAKARDFCAVKPADSNECQGFGRCYNLSNNKRIYFNIGNISSSRRNLGYDGCFDGLQLWSGLGSCTAHPAFTYRIVEP